VGDDGEDCAVSKTLYMETTSIALGVGAVVQEGPMIAPCLCGSADCPRCFPHAPTTDDLDAFNEAADRAYEAWRQEQVDNDLEAN
jgi:hypothetical protein